MLDPVAISVAVGSVIFSAILTAAVLISLCAIERRIMKTQEELQQGLNEAAQKVVDEIRTTAAQEKQQYLDVLAAVKAQSGITDEAFAAAIASVEGISPAVKESIEAIANPADATS